MDAAGKWLGTGQRGLRTPADGCLRVAPLLELPPVLREFGVDPAALFAAAGVELSLLDDPDNPIPFVTMGALLGAGVRATGCAHLGLLVGMRSSAPVLGLVGELLRHSPTVGDALRNLIAYLHVHDRGAVPTLVEDGTTAALGYAIYQRDTPEAAQIYDGALAVAANIVRGLCGPRWRPSEALLSRRSPPDTGPYRRFFRCPLRFDAEQSAVVFPSNWLAHPVTAADPGVYRILLRQVALLESAIADDFAAQVKRTLRTLVVANRASADDVAELFLLHRRTVSRKLRQQNTSFRALAEQARYEVARQLLEDTQMPISTIAGTLGYADPSAFTRAFVRWTGMTPAVWRAGGSPGGANCLK